MVERIEGLWVRSVVSVAVTFSRPLRKLMMFSYISQDDLNSEEDRKSVV